MIESMAKKYEHNADELQRAIYRAAEEDLNYDEVAPGTEQVEQDDIIGGSKERESFVFFNPDCPKAHRDYDIGSDLGPV